MLTSHRTLVAFLLTLFFFAPSLASAQVGDQLVIIQKKAHSKKGRFEISAFFGWVANNPYLTYLPIEGRLAYHISEGFGIEASFGYYPPFGSGPNRYSGPIKNRLVDDLRRDPHFVRVELYEQQVFYAHFDLLWTPIYGKLNIESLSWIGYWEIFLQLGGGFIGIRDQEFSGNYASDESNPIRIRPTVNFGIGNRFWVTNWFALRLDIRHFLYQRQFGNGGISQNLTLSAGISFVI